MTLDPSSRRVLRRAARQTGYRLATSDGIERIAMSSGFTRHAAFRRARRYVAGLDENAAIAVVRELRCQGLAASVDLFGEDVHDAATTDAVVDRYRALSERLATEPGAYLSLDCSHLGLDAGAGACGARVRQIARGVPDGMYLQLGAEQSARTDAILEIALDAAADGLPVMQTVQANLRRSPQDVESLVAAAIPIRLVKGAFVEPAGIAPLGYRDRCRLRRAGRAAGGARRAPCARHARPGDPRAPAPTALGHRRGVSARRASR